MNIARIRGSPPACRAEAARSRRWRGGGRPGQEEGQARGRGSADASARHRGTDECAGPAGGREGERGRQVGS
eukprot:955448-Alexandrium_andersonii.AAC.1